MQPWTYNYIYMYVYGMSEQNISKSLDSTQAPPLRRHGKQPGQSERASESRRKVQSMMAEQQREEPEYLLVRFEGNASKCWDGRETEVPSRTVVRSGRREADGSEIAKVHWPGKGGKAKVWCYVVLAGEEEEVVAVPCAKRVRMEGAELEVEMSQSTATAPASAASPGPSASCSSHAP